MKDQMLAAGVLPTDIGSWCSDLYVKVTPVSEKIIAEYKYKCNVTTFRSNIDSLTWYEIPFANDAYYKLGVASPRKEEVLNG